LKSGLIKNVNNSNIISNTEYISNAKLAIPRNSNDTDEIVITLNEIVIEKLEKLSVFVHDGFEVNSFKMESAATAFLCGYLIVKVAESVNNCELCLSTLRNTSPEKTSPLLELIYNQDRGKLNYPNERFVGLIEFVVDIMIEILPSLPKENVDFILKNVLSSYLLHNPVFQCSVHYGIVCDTIMKKLIPPVLINFCNLQSKYLKKIYQY
jgi:hypothetical protein